LTVAELIARVDGREVGRFSEQHVADGSLFSFEYIERATVEDLVSLTMIPLPHQRRFDSRSFPPAFDMILPEGERRQKIESARKIVRTDDFSLLSYVGANPINRVRFLQPEAAVDQEAPQLPTPKEIVLMGENSATKYQRDYGSMIESLALFVEAQAEDVMRRDMTKALVLNWLLGNGDAHLKNFGVLYHNDLDVRLAPFYDVVSTLPYIAEDVPALALSFEWYSKDWWPCARMEEFART
jgi:HipA-like protein